MNYKHGFSHRAEYHAWGNMIARCYNRNSINYREYGGRGIRVCKRWKNGFINFLHDMGEKPNKSFTLDRIDGSKGYYPQNCRWATRLEQTKNRRKNKYRFRHPLTKTPAMKRRESRSDKALKVLFNNISKRKLSASLGLSHQALTYWTRIPERHVDAIEAISGINKKRLRPDLFA